MRNGWRRGVALLGSALMVAGVIATAAPADAVVGGRPASTRTYPWLVALRTPVFPVSFCGGTLLAPTKVLTAGHCVDQFLAIPALLHVVAGRDDQSTNAGTDVTVRKIWRDPGYSTFTFQGETGYRNDVAVLTLDRPVTTGTLPIADAGQRRLYRPGTGARILGWGTTSETATDPGLLRTARVRVVSDTLCGSGQSYGSAYDPKQYVCAGDFRRGGVDTCEFDSGTPLVVEGHVAGITSWGVGCARPHFPGLYTRVSTFADEIKAQLRD